MKIVGVDVIQVCNPTNPNVKPVVCRVYTDKGLFGDGEAAMAYGVGSGGAFGILQDLARLIIGMNPLENEVVWQKLFKQTFWGQNGGGIFSAGISAIDIALWDIRGKHFGVPVYTLLGGKLNDNLRTYASQLQFGWQPGVLSMHTLDDYKNAARKAVSEGYDCVKIDFFTFKEDPAEGTFSDHERSTLLPPERLGLVVDRVEAVREAVGPSVDIIVENHSFLDAQTAIQIGKAVEKFNILYFEEPNTPDPDTAKFIAARLSIPIASGERIYTRWQYSKYFRDSSLQVVQPDLGTCGGISEAKKICDMAYVYDIEVQIHICASPLCTAAALQIEAAIPNFLIHEHHICNLDDFNRRMCKYDYQPVNGRFKVPDLPGIGNEWTDLVLNQERKITIEGEQVAWKM